MLGIFYLILCFLSGFCIIEFVFKNIGVLTENSFYGKKINISDA